MEYRENQLNYEIYCSLRESVGWKNNSEAQVRKALQNSYYDLVVYDRETPVGMARVIGDGTYHIICDVIVSPEYQGQGIGKMLMNKLTGYIEESTFDGSRVSVQLIAEKGKEPFYEKQGFKLIPHEYCGSGMRKVIYKKYFF